MKKRITQADIAKLANVTRQTVSLVVNNDPRVNKDTRNKILQLMEELDYSPNVTARNLASKQSKCIGYHFFDLERATFNQPLFTESLAGIYFRTNELDYNIKLYRLNPDQDYAASYRSGEIDGAIFVTYDKTTVEDELIPLLDKGFPLIIIGNHPQIPHVSIDHEAGSRMALNKLFKTKRKNILYLGGGLDFYSNQQKFKAYQKLLKESNLTEKKELIHHTVYRVDQGYDLVKDLLAKGIKFDAIFSAAADLPAVGACRALAESDISVPDDVSVIGYDNSVYAQFSTPPLSSIASPFYEMGRTAVEMIIDFIKNEEPPKPIYLNPELVLRESCK